MTFERPTPAARGHSFSTVHTALRDAIICGELGAGTITTQMALAERYLVGRTPLREALRVLQSEGLVVNEPNRRVQITALSVADAEELYVARILLEATAVRQTIPGFRRRDDAEMLGYLAQMDHYGEDRDWVGLREPHRAFHTKLYAGGGTRIVGLIDELSDHAERYRQRRVSGPGRWATRQAEHRTIVDAVGKRDVHRVEELLIGHYARTAGMVCYDLDPVAGLERLRDVLARTAPSAEVALDEGAREAASQAAATGVLSR